MTALEVLFPELRQNVAAQQQSQISGALGLMAVQHQGQYDKVTAARESEATRAVKSWLWEDDYPALLNLANTRNEEAGLIAACSF